MSPAPSRLKYISQLVKPPAVKAVSVLIFSTWQSLSVPAVVGSILCPEFLGES